MRESIKMVQKKSPAITEYDKSGYDYSKYWKRERRDYEHTAEETALTRMINAAQKERRNFFVDFGGGYGRLMPIYASEFKNVILLDYSMKNLDRGLADAEKYGITNISFVAANLYHLPFKEKSVDVGALIRVIHHIENLLLLFEELGRACASSMIVDCPNKRHFLALARALFKGNVQQRLSDAPCQQPHRDDSQDFTGGPQIFLNHNPKTVEKIAQSFGFKRKKRLSVSNLRRPGVKSIIPLPILNRIESALQFIFAPLLFGPHIWMLFQKKAPSTVEAASIHDILACPKCKGKLKFRKNDTRCTKCGKIWKLEGKIWDFRYK